MTRTAIALASVLFLIVACTSPSASPGGGGTIKIGGGFALTGEEASLDVPAANGAKLAVKQINAAGGVNGSQIDFIVHDSQYIATVAAQTAKQFVEQDKVPVMIGYTDTDSVTAAGPTFQNAKVPFITIGATSPKIPTQIGSTRCPSLSRRMTIGTLVIGSTIRPLIVISICMAAPRHCAARPAPL